MSDRDPGVLLEILEEARGLGLLGPGPVARQLEHALDLATAVGEFAGRMLDLGSGGGLPGLVLFEHWQDATGVLLDAQRRRCEFLTRAVATLDLGSRVSVECGRAERLARDEHLRAGFDLVVARSFGAPAVTAECAVGFLRQGGDLVVTEPPDSDAVERWPVSGLTELGFEAAEPMRVSDTGAVRMRLRGAVDDRWPRRDGVPAKRPLW
jgi:16S rRNA (guanine527-N7)-methyltransferase